MPSMTAQCAPEHPVNVLVPADLATPAIATLVPCSALVSCPECFSMSEERIIVDLEGDTYERGWSAFTKLVHASGRHSTRYPTIARRFMSSHELVVVGEFQVKDGRLFVEDRDAFERWYGEPADNVIREARLDHLSRDLGRRASKPPRSHSDEIALLRDMEEFKALTAAGASS